MRQVARAGRFAAPCRLLGLALLLATARDTAAQGHGPIFGLSTPTLGRGGWSLDVTGMGRIAGSSRAVMLRPMVSYGLTEDVQLSASVPMPLYGRGGLPPSRTSMRMPASPDVELMVGWRFHRHAPGVGSRFESTAYVGFAYPTDAVRRGIATAPGMAGGLVTGYASRTVYLWVGGLYRRYMHPIGANADHAGDLAMGSFVIGYRPPAFRHDYPHPDWRVFVEVVGESVARDRVGGVPQPDTGGGQVFAGPTLLGLYGAWGISGGPLFPVHRQVNGRQPKEKVRFALDVVFWF